MSDRRWCARCSRQLPDGWDAVICSCGYSGMTYNAPQNDVSTLAKHMREETDRIAKQVLYRDYAKRVEQSFAKPLTYNQTNTTVPVYYTNTSSTLKFKPKQKENDMNVTANSTPTVGGFRAVIIGGTLDNLAMVSTNRVIWESTKVYKTHEKATAAAQRRIAEGLQAVFG